jgi:hypothetical protein
VVVDHALGIAGGAGGVVQRDGLPFVGGQGSGELGGRGYDELVIVMRADAGAFGKGGIVGVFGVVIINDHRLDRGQCKRLGHDGRELAVDDEDPAIGVIELECDGLRIKPGVDGVQHGSDHRHAVMGFQHGGCVRQHHRDGVAL